jgi:Holliday junction resolvase RusA-like endonuclease
VRRTFTVYGKPRPQGSLRTLIPLRGGKPTIVPADAGVYRYRADIQNEWRFMFPDVAPLEGPVILHCVFMFRRPDSHYLPPAKTKGRAAREELRPGAPIHYVSTPDVDKLVRAVGDSLTGFAYGDDAQVSEAHASKVWGERDQTTIDVLQWGDVES